MRDSERYLAQAETVMRMAVRADSPAEKAVYVSIAEGWRKLAAEAARHERQDNGHVASETRSFKSKD
jgi:hypothetical protein